MNIPLRFTRAGIAGWFFRRSRADWYEYVADMAADSDGRYTIRHILEKDATRYGTLTVRGILSHHWAHRIVETGDLGQVLAGTLPAREVAHIAALQNQGHAVFVAGLQDLARQVRLIGQLRRVLSGSLWSAALAMVLVAIMVLGIWPHFTAPEIQAAFGHVPDEYLKPSSRAFFSRAQWLRENGQLLIFAAALATVVFLQSFRWFDGPLRRRLDHFGPWRLYRDIQAIFLVSAAAMALKPRGGETGSLRQVLRAQRVGASRWLENRVDAMLQRMDDAKAGAKVFDVGLMDGETYWYLEDMTGPHGLDTALQKASSRLQTRLLSRVQQRAVVLRWILLLSAVFALLVILLLHYMVINDMRNAIMLGSV